MLHVFTIQLIPFQSLFSTTAFGLGAKYFAFYEEEGVGVHWNNIYISPLENDDYNLFFVTVMMAIDSLLYGLLVWYIENVHPGKDEKNFNHLHKIFGHLGKFAC